MTDKTYNVLFLCTGNSSRSILAKSILNKEGAGRFRAFAQAARFLKNRITAFINLPIASLDRMALERQVRQIGTPEGALLKSAKAQ